MADLQESALRKKDGGISLFPAEGEQDDYECGRCGQMFRNGAPIDRGLGCYRCMPRQDRPAVVEQLDLAIHTEFPNMDTAKCRFLYYGRKLEEGSDTPYRINQDAFASVVMRTRFGNMSEADAEVVKQICLKGLKTFEDGNKEKFDRVSVARILCDDLAFWDEDDKTLAF